MKLHLLVLILSLLPTEFVRVCYERPDNDSLENVITKHIEGLELRSKYSTQNGVDSIAHEIDLIFQKHSEDIANNPKLKESFDKYYALLWQIQEKAEQDKKDSIEKLFSKQAKSYDSLYTIGQQLAKNKKGDSVVVLKRKEMDYWITVKNMGNNHSAALQSDPELQNLIDTINLRHEQISALSEERATSLGDVLLKFAPLLFSLVAIGMAVKGKIDMVKKDKQLKAKEKEAELLLKKQQEDFLKRQEEAKNAQE